MVLHNTCTFSAVGREWRWKMDDPLTIVCGAIDNHVKMINEYKGVPGVQAARLQEGFQVIRLPVTCHRSMQVCKIC